MKPLWIVLLREGEHVGFGDLSAAAGDAHADLKFREFHEDPAGCSSQC
jgi:hypothetical protein